MKGKNTFTTEEISELRKLIMKRQNASCDEQKRIRNKMRAIGFYGKDEWGILDCQLSDLDALIKREQIRVVGMLPDTLKICLKTQMEHVMKNSIIRGIDFKTIENLQQAGFVGFIPIADLWEDCSAIPRTKGVYMVVRTTTVAPEFLKQGSGGFFQDKDPNVPLDILRANWVNDTCVIYIGKAGGVSSSATLHSRLKQYLQFGQGKAVGHRGGRYIWQLKDAADLLFCWMSLPSDDPIDIEINLIRTFKERYNGMRPFANLKD